MQTLRNALEQSEKDGVAIGHFNVADLVLLKVVVAAARDLKVPVAVGASEGEREFFGVRQIAALVLPESVTSAPEFAAAAIEGKASIVAPIGRAT